MSNTFLSNIELYYSNLIDRNSGLITVEGEEYNHIFKVMRHQSGDEIYLTEGLGRIYKSKIVEMGKNYLNAQIIQTFNYEERFPNITFCIPILRNTDRFEFALEKCTELSVTNYIFYHADRSVKKNVNQKRVDKILLAGMKQSLLSWKPKFDYVKALKDIFALTYDKIIFDQASSVNFDKEKIDKNNPQLLIFGPEGGFSDQEIQLFGDCQNYKLGENRLRTETAIIKAASLL